VEPHIVFLDVLIQIVSRLRSNEFGLHYLEALSLDVAI
jgi:hypothetical protein